MLEVKVVAATLLGLAQAGLAAEIEAAAENAVEEVKTFYNGLSTIQRVVFITACAFVGLMLLVCCICVPVYCRNRRMRKERLMMANPYMDDGPNEWGARAGGATLAEKVSGKPSPSLASFMKSNPAANSGRVKDLEAGEDSDSDGGSSAVSKDPITIKGKRISTRATGNDYGLLDSDAKARIQSIRMEGNLMPIQVSKPSAKALKMLGVEENAISRPFDEDVKTRMERLAKNTGGGVYANSFGTAKLGNQIAAGFKERRAKQLEKAKLRKEKEEQKRMQKEGSKPAPPPPKPKAEEHVKKEAPGPNKLAAFLAQTSSASNKVEQNDDSDHTESENESESGSEHDDDDDDGSIDDTI